MDGKVRGQMQKADFWLDHQSHLLKGTNCYLGQGRKGSETRWMMLQGARRLGTAWIKAV